MSGLQFVTDCIHSTAERIHALRESAVPVTYKTARRHIGDAALSGAFPFYDWGPRRGGLRMSKDWAVRYYRSIYNGRRCYYVEHSRIEYIFANQE